MTHMTIMSSASVKPALFFRVRELRERERVFTLYESYEITDTLYFIIIYIFATFFVAAASTASYRKNQYDTPPWRPLCPGGQARYSYISPCYDI